MTDDAWRERKRAADRKYRASAKGRAKRQRFVASESGRAAARRSNDVARSRGRKRLDAARALGCVVCGSHDGLDFHHVDPATRRYGMSDMHKLSDALFYAELAKCELLCRQHHKDRHRVLNSTDAGRSARAQQRRRALFTSLGWVQGQSV